MAVPTKVSGGIKENSIIFTDGGSWLVRKNN